MVSKIFKRRGPTAPTAKACASMFLLLLVFGPSALESERKGRLSSVVVKRKRVLCGWCRGAPGHRGCPHACQMA